MVLFGVAVLLSAQDYRSSRPDWAAGRKVHERKYEDLRHRKCLLQYYEDDPAFDGLTSLDTLVSGYWVLTLGTTEIYPVMIGWKTESDNTPSRYEVLELAEVYFRYHWYPGKTVYETPEFRVYVKSKSFYEDE